MKEFLKRTLTAVVLIVALYFIILYTPDRVFSLLIFGIVSLAAYEWIRLCEPNRRSFTIILLSGLLVGSTFTFSVPDPVLTFFLVILLGGVFFLIAVNKKEYLSDFVRDVGIHFMAVFYIFFPLYFLLELRRYGNHYLFFLIFVIAIGDTGAYLVGSLLGKRKIYPVASPNKTLEGVIAAVFTAALAAFGALYIFSLEVEPWIAALTGAVIGLLSQLSDPIESLFKRAAGKKDSGSILPGHGGVLDRLDSYIFCAPAFYFLILYFWR